MPSSQQAQVPALSGFSEFRKTVEGDLTQAMAACADADALRQSNGMALATYFAE